MDFREHGGLLVPVRNTPVIRVFVDETVFADRSGFVQSGIVVPEPHYSEAIVPECKKMLRRLGKDAKEFKASHITARNAGSYAEFLKMWTHVIAEVAGQCGLHSIVSVDGTVPYAGGYFSFFKSIVNKVLAHHKVPHGGFIVEEFCRQLLWMRYHLPKIGSKMYANPFDFTFDNKHRYAQEARSWREAKTSYGQTAIWEFGRFLTSMTGPLVKKAPERIPIASIGRFDFKWSQTECGLQAADLFSNLFYHAIRREAGFREKRTALRADLLRDVVPGFVVPDNVAAVFKKDRGDISFGRKHVVSTIQIDAA